MHERSSIIFDLTGETAVMAVASSGRVQLVEDFAPRFRVTLAEVAGEIVALDDASRAQDRRGGRRLTFDHLNHCLHLIEDEELQSRLVEAIWRDLVEAASERGFIDDRRSCAAYLVAPHSYPLALVD